MRLVLELLLREGTGLGRCVIIHICNARLVADRSLFNRPPYDKEDLSGYKPTATDELV